MKRISAISFFLFSLFLAACNKNSTEKCAFVPDTKNISIDLKWESLEDSLPSIKTKEQLVGFLRRHPIINYEFLGGRGRLNDTTFVNARFQKFTHPAIDSLLMETHQIFANDAAELKREFAQAFANVKYYYPNFQPPKIQTVITGFERDIFVSDTLVVIALDYFLGPKAKYQNLELFDYIKRRYQPAFIVPSVMLLYGFDEQFNKVNEEDRTMLAEMIGYGKAYYFAKQMTPCTPDSVLIGYTAEEIRGSRNNESLIWSRLIEDQVLFSTNTQDKQKYILERPKTLEVGEKCPGRIGQWVGWRMIQSYNEKHPDQTLQQIMKMSDAQKMFKDSGYKPQIQQVPSREKV
ncbi:MAG TPA: gliding motility lipoprotein GldB [Cyclobacteriaceae bacterium]|nr:gliding motility lipoprotein GldB [Cyclobacteriaceae bacterium]